MVILVAVILKTSLLTKVPKLVVKLSVEVLLTKSLLSQVLKVEVKVLVVSKSKEKEVILALNMSIKILNPVREVDQNLLEAAKDLALKCLLILDLVISIDLQWVEVNLLRQEEED